MPKRSYGDQDSAEFANQFVPAKYIAVLFGLSHSRVSQLVNEGVLHYSDDAPVAKRFKLKDVVSEWVSYKEGKSDNTDKLETEKLQAEVASKKARAKREEILLKELEGKMHRSSDVKEAMDALIFSFRSGLMALPGRVAVDVVGANSPAVAANIIKREVYKIMEEISNFTYDPEKFAEMVAEREGLGDSGNSEDDD